MVIHRIKIEELRAFEKTGELVAGGKFLFICEGRRNWWSAQSFFCLISEFRKQTNECDELKRLFRIIFNNLVCAGIAKTCDSSGKHHHEPPLLVYIRCIR